MSLVLDFLLSGGRVRQKVASYLHGAIWARRSFGGRSDTPDMRLLDDVKLLGRVAIDVGAHAGNWTQNLARRVGLDGTVLAYEALPHYGRALTWSTRLLRGRNVQVRVVAVGNREGLIPLRWRSVANERLTGTTHIEPGVKNSAGVIEVRMVTLDSDLASHGIHPSDVAFVKIDVEGAELEVLRGARGLLSRGRPVVYMEVEPLWLERMGHSVNDVFDLMALHGYEPSLVTESGLVGTDVDSYLSQYADRCEFNNVLFRPSTSQAKV